MQTILGAGGAIGTELAKALPKYTDKIRLVGRNPKKVNEEDELFSADLTKAEQVLQAVVGSEVVYLTVGLTYTTKVWQEYWPVIMNNVIKACKAHKTKLVFFDNIYMYDPESLGDITEDNPVNPSSKKGIVRAQIARQLLDAIRSGELEGLIARSADFYGPGMDIVSMMTETIFRPLSEGKKASIIGRADVPHSFTYTPDAGKATALLGNSHDAYGEVWHLPTASNPLTMQGYLELFAREMSIKPKYMTANKFMMSILGLFIPVMKELKEMYYQFDRPYIFNSQKFEKCFGFEPTGYEDGVKEVIRSDYQKS